jgi:carboxymethylenebutenolidase
VNGIFIDIPAHDSGKFQAYLSTPPQGRGPGLLVIQEIFGVNDHIRKVADGYAAQGYAVLAPDLFWRAEARVELGYAPSDQQRGKALRQQIPPATMVRDLQTSAAALRKYLDEAGKIGAVGYCMGGRMAFELASTGCIDAAIDYYGAGTAALLHLADAIKIPLQFHFGARDALIPAAEVEQIRAAFAARDDVEIFVYAEAEHGFNCDQRASYHQPSAELAGGRALQFLRTHIGPL